MKDVLQILFVAYLILTIAGALGAVLLKGLVRALVALVGGMLGMAGIYLFLNSPFLAFMQLLIYVGAVCVMIFFAIMLAEPPGAKDEIKPRLGRFSLGLLAGGSVLIATALAFKYQSIHGQWLIRPTNVAQIGKDFLTQYVLVFELISLILLVAIIGSVLIARLRGKSDDV